MNRGTCIWFTGLCNTGKSTIADAMLPHLNGRTVVLDEDRVREMLWSELGSSRAERHRKALRLAYTASLITKVGGLAICIMISPYREDREAARKLIEPYGDFFEVFVDTPLEVCEKRDQRHFYERARQNLIELFT